jgi:polysaccharide export outer membrane protein
MEVFRHCLFSQNAVLAILTLLGVSTAGWTDGGRTNSEPRPLVAKISAMVVESTKRGNEFSPIVIEQIWTSNVGPHVQVHVVGSDYFSCTTFQLNNPHRLVLDCPRAHLRVQQTPIRVDLDPVRAVRVGQFKADVARVVIDLERQSPYRVQSAGNTVTAVFDATSWAPSGSETARNKQGIGSRRDQRGPDDKASADTNTQVVPDKLPLMGDRAANPSAAVSAVFPPTRSAAAPAEARPAPVPLNHLRGFQDDSSETSRPTAKLDSTPTDQDYVIGPQDVLGINVWHEPELSRSVPVRPDGKISLPLVGELQVSGLTPRLLQTRLVKEFEAYIRKPQVTVIIQEVNSRKFYIMGEVQHPGAYPLTTSMTVLDALATAGGFRDFAKVTKIIVLRPDPDGTRRRISFDYKQAIRGGRSAGLQLLSGDTVIVP